MNDHHFFASTAYHWVTAKTQELALSKLAGMHDVNQIKRAVVANGGLRFWLWRVDAPAKAEYEIHPVEGPQGVNSEIIEKGLFQTRSGRFVSTFEPPAPPPVPATPLGMAGDQFEALAKLSRLQDGNAAREALRLMSVEGLERAEVIERTGISPQALTNAVTRFKDAQALARVACGLPEQSEALELAP